ncbi:MAG TPA: RDD family protein [Nevskiales bacterium]|nr:RDD family protein [Nevskiales bacterium]
MGKTTPPASPAGLLPRLGAALYDLLLLLALFFLATALVDPLMPQDHVPAGSLWFQLYLLLVAFLFYGWFWTHGGQTLGMRAWRLRVVTRDGAALRWPRAALRFLVAVPSWLSLLGLLCCAIDGHALHDRLSGTQTLRLPKP